MSELSGTLEGVGLPAIVRFLAGLKKTGCLRISHADLRGEIFFDAGQVCGASIGSRRGLSALDAMVQALPGGSFTLESDVRPTDGASIDLSQEALQGHLAELASRAANGTPQLPSVEVVPQLLHTEEQSEEPLPLDRGTLQTLLAVDGQRTVRDIIAQRGTWDALWQLASLGEVGLISLTTTRSDATPSPVSPVVRPAVADATAFSRPATLEVKTDEPASHCPKLGFEDDPANSFGRPTRLHRCFAPGTPLPLSLDQQRELCLTEQFGTCPRLGLTAAGPDGARRTPPVIPPAPAVGRAERAAQSAADSTPGSGHPRIVRLPFIARAAAGERGAVTDRQAVGGPEPTRFRNAAAPAQDTVTPPPTPLRARIARSEGPADGAAATVAAGAPAAAAAPAAGIRPGAAGARPGVAGARPAAAGAAAADAAGAAGPRPAGSPLSAAVAPRPPADKDADPTSTAPLDKPLLGGADRRIFGVPVAVLPGAVVILAVIGAVAYLLLPQMGDLLSEDPLNSAALPTSVALVNSGGAPQLTPQVRATVAARATAVSATDATTPGGAAAAAGAASAATPAAQPTVSAQPTAVVAAQPSADQPSASQPAASQPAAGQPTEPGAAEPSTILDERFTTNSRNWPSSAQGTAQWASGSYRLSTRQAGQFVAIGAPIVDLLQDVIVSASFHKVSGPVGGGYGIILRDQATTPQNGTLQDGNYYVLEVGDKGEIGIWRRDADHWVDLLPWQRSDAVKSGTAVNDVTARASGSTLTLSVNGTPVASRSDATYPTGGAGIFVGGDGNVVAVDRFTIQKP